MDTENAKIAKGCEQKRKTAADAVEVRGGNGFLLGSPLGRARAIP